MSWSASRIVCVLVGPLLSSACAAGSDDGLSGFSSAAYTSNGGDGSTSSGGESEDTNNVSAEGPQPTADGTTSGGSNSGGDGGNPLCCMPGGQAGCDSEVTEACVCTSQPSCCQNVWSQECVDLAIACGDPFCTDEPGTSGDPTSGGNLECDPDFSFVPEPVAGAMFKVSFTDPVGLTWVKMNAEGPGGVTIGGTNEVISGGPGAFFWTYDYSGLAAGVWTFVFTSKDTEGGPDIVRGTCEKQL